MHEFLARLYGNHFFFCHGDTVSERKCLANRFLRGVSNKVQRKNLTRATIISIMESIGKEIKEIARNKGVSLYRIAKDLGIAQESLFRSLMDDANPKWNTVKKILDYLGCEIRIGKAGRDKRL